MRWLLFFLLLALPASAREGVALVVGLDRYEHLSALEHAESDARLLAGALKASGYEVDLLHGTLTDRPELERRLARLAASARPDEQVLVAFFGHSLEGHLMLRDSHPGRLAETALPAEALGRALAGLKTLLLLDGWRNEPVQAKCCSDNRLTLEVVTRFRAVGQPIFACSPGQRAFDWTEQGHGFFAYYLVEAIRAGYRTPQSLLVYLSARVDRDCRRVMLQSQRPHLEN